MRIGIDLTWLKPQKSGGVEAYAKNLLDGFAKLEDEIGRASCRERV